MAKSRLIQPVKINKTSLLKPYCRAMISSPLSVHLLFLVGLLQTCFLLCVAKEYYVTPTQPSNFTCPTGKPCHTLNEYIIKSLSFFVGEDEVSLLFVSGHHDVTVASWNLNDIKNLTLKGLNSSNILDSPRIILHADLHIIPININTFEIEYLNINLESRHWIYFITGNVQNIIQNHVQTFRCSYTILPGNYELHNTVNHELHLVVTGSVLFQDSIFTSGSFFQLYAQNNLSSFVLRNVTYFGNSLHYRSISYNNLKSFNNITIDNCYFEDNEGSPSFLLISNSKVYFKAKTTFANNIGVQGGAMNLLSSHVYLENDSSITFINNSVIDVGGAIYTIDCSIINDDNKCFYQLPPGYNRNSSNITVSFINNTAKKGGDHVYGASFKIKCNTNPTNYDYLPSYEIQEKVFQFIDKPRHDLSHVASRPERVCLCDEKGQPQCANYSYIVQHRALAPGEKFNLSVAVVGGDFGAVTGVVYATIDGPSNEGHLLGDGKLIDSPVCTSLEYSVHSSGNKLSFFIGVDSRQIIDNYLNGSIKIYEENQYINDTLRSSPVLINIDIQVCPVGFMLNNGSYTCECSEDLIRNGIDHCIVNNSEGLVYRNETIWIGLSKTNDSSNTTELLFSHHCPYEYCKTDNIPVDLNDSDFQCELNRTGNLCGSCPSDLSLALGSLQCLNCTNNGGLALMIGFVAAGPALVFLIKMLDLTVSWGTINGLILYANIMWINRNILFQSKGITSSTSFSQDYLSNSGVHNGTTGLVADRFTSTLAVFKVFVAWLNLDFGIESCFFQGLNAYWKTWLQYVFPIYLWIIVLTIIVLCRYSTKLTKVFGNNIVGVLATLFLMSYIKLLRTIVTVFGFAALISQDGPRYVWLFDGTVLYLHWPHTILFVTALLVLIFLILPYTLTLLCVPYLKRKSDYYLLSWINKFKPIFDVYYGPLKDKYHYWIGVTLLIRVLLALLNETSQNIPSNIILAITASISAVMSVLVTHVYKSIYLSALEGFFLMNLTLLCVSFITINNTESRAILVCVSIAVSFLTFLGILTFHVYARIKKCLKSNSEDGNHNDSQRRREQHVTTTYAACNQPLKGTNELRESLLESVTSYK